MKILAIETSCDETSVAIVEDGYKLLSLVTNSQIDIQKAFGGVVPEIAARSHVEVMVSVVAQAMDEAFASTKSQAPNFKQIQNTKSQKSKLDQHDMLEYWNEIDAIAVTQGPGLSGALLIGTLTARTLAWSIKKPLYPVHHIMGHIYANWITEADAVVFSAGQVVLPSAQPKFPILALIVSGGHTQLMYATNHTDWRVLGRTRDDAVGEAFDKVAKVLDYPYPGGVSVSKAAELGDPKKYHLPTPRVDTPYDFSFSGLKTAVLRAVQRECGKSHDFPSFKLAALLNDQQRNDFAASFQAIAIDYLVSKTKKAFDEFQPNTVIIGGGVAASQPLRDALSSALPIDIQYAPQVLCTDNAAMIGARAFFQSQTDAPIDPNDLEIKPSWPL